MDDERLADDDNANLIEGSAETAGFASDAGESAGEGADRKRRRRRRRRSKSPQEQSRPSSGAAADSNAADDDGAADEELAPATDFDAFDDDFEKPVQSGEPDAVADEAPSDESAAKAERRRRPRRRRGADSPGETVRAPAQVAARTQSPADDDDDDDVDDVLGGAEGDDDDDGVDQVVNYSNVPTWEEAISYLLRPSQVQVEPGSSSPGSAHRGGASGEVGKTPTRHYGGKRRS